MPRFIWIVVLLLASFGCRGDVDSGVSIVLAENYVEVEDGGGSCRVAYTLKNPVKGVFSSHDFSRY